MDTNINTDKSILDDIIKFINQIHYGEVVITIHNSEIVQIEKREKKRFIVKGRPQERS